LLFFSLTHILSPSSSPSFPNQVKQNEENGPNKTILIKREISTNIIPILQKVGGEGKREGGKEGEGEEEEGGKMLKSSSIIFSLAPSE